MTVKNIVIGSDHAGFDLKEDLKGVLSGEGFEVEDMGPETETRVDYPDYAESVSKKIAEGDGDLGILVCGTGLGMCMVANKVKGIRAALLYNEAAARYARLHNNANVIVFGGRTMSHEEARKYLHAFLDETFEGGRHKMRIDKMKKLEARGHNRTGGD